MKTITLTNQLLHDASTHGYHGFTKAQLAILGIKWPPKQGWLKSLVGHEVTADQYDAFKQAGQLKRQSAQKSGSRSALLSSGEFVRLHPQPDGNYYLTHAQNEPVTLDFLNQLVRAINYTRKQLK